MIGSIIFLTTLLHCHGDFQTKNFILEVKPESEILAIDTNYGMSLAVATRDHIFIYAQPVGYSSAQGSLLGTIKLPTPVIRKSGFLEFKLIAKQQIFYCDQSSCRFCTTSRHNFSCSEFVIQIEGKVPKVLNFVAATRAEERIYLRAVSNEGTAILSYDLQDTGKINQTQYALDAPFIAEQLTIGAFSRLGYAYFVGSARQPHEPWINANLVDDSANYSFVKITRVCANDQTTSLESRIDLALTCDRSFNDSSIVVASHYNAQVDQLLVVFRSPNGNKSHSLCSFDMKQVHTEFEKIWNTCQEVRIMDNSRDCERYANQGEALKDHCYYITHKGDGYATTNCIRFGNDDKEKFSNCDLHRRQSSSYRYGWLESYLPYSGRLVARMEIAQEYSWTILPGNRLDSEANSVFIATSAGQSGNILRVRLDKELPNSRISPIVWSTTSNPPSHRSIALSSTGDTFYLLNQSRIAAVQISCGELYKTCDELANGGWQDALNCIWCPDEGKEQVIAAQEVKSCEKPLNSICPPVLDHANRDQNHSEWQIFGTNLNRLQDSVVYVCDHICTVNQGLSTDQKLHCYLSDGSEQDSNCEVRVVGSLGNHKQFSIRANKVTNSVGVGTDVIEARSSADNSSSKSNSRVWKAILAVVVVLLILIAIVVIVWFARKRMMGNTEKNNDDNGSTIGLSSPHTFLHNSARRRSNSYVGPDSIRMETVNIYERLFNEIDEQIKIPVDHLRLEKELGKGHFGVVNRATYMAPDGTQLKVACKTIKDNVAGVREFIDEGLTMSRFNHSRLLKLIGIAFTGEKCPIIITEYMVNGDLVNYLRDKNNSPTLRVLLTFATQIAEGMEYLHECNFIHRDLAARNCMLDNMLQIKIADFGLCRECNEDNMYEPSIKNRDLPLRWMSLEALQDEKFTFKGDVWAYGVVLWELMTRGMTPYGTLKGIIILDFLRRGDRLSIPPYCPIQLYEHIMLPCWSAEPDDRPTFTELVASVEELISNMERSQNTQLYTHYERVSTTTPTATQSDSSGFGNVLR